MYIKDGSPLSCGTTDNKDYRRLICSCFLENVSEFMGLLCNSFGKEKHTLYFENVFFLIELPNNHTA